MASLYIPPTAGPTSTQLDRRHTGERSSASRGENRSRNGANRSERGRGGRGGRRGGTSTRGGRAHGSPPTEKSTDTPPPRPVPAKSAPPIVSAPSHTSTASKSSSSSLPQPLPAVDLPGKPKAGPRSAPQQAVDKLPSLTIEPASPTTMPPSSARRSASTTSSRLSSTRRRRSHNKPTGTTASSETLTVEELASAVMARKSRSGPSSPQPKESQSKNTPPHLSAGPTVTSFSTKTNIESLVEHVRALAMDHRPSTPGSHIDWAGDDDDSLPDLDDWGVSTGPVASAGPNPGTTLSAEKAQLQLMSPILDDSLKQLPQNFDKSTPSPSVGSGSLSPNIADRVPAPLVSGSDEHSGVHVAEASPPSAGVDKEKDSSLRLSEPPSQPGSPSPPDDSHALEPSLPSERTPPSITRPQEETPHPSGPSSELPASAPSLTPPTEAGRSLADSIHAPSRTAQAPPEADVAEPAADNKTNGLSASAPKPSESRSDPTEGPRAVPASRNPTHGRSHTLGRQPPYSAGAKRGFLSGSSTPGGVTVGKGPHHGRTQSSPVTHRRQHSRPVITLDGLTRLAKSLGTSVPKREVTATNSATSSE